MADSQDEHNINPNAGYVYSVVVSYNLYSLINLIILLFHSFKVYQDLYTKPRLSVSHRRSPPQITKSYKFMNIVTLFSVTCFTLSSITGALPMAVAETESICDGFKTVHIMLTEIGKISMYMVFLVRLYSVYEKSAYSYPLKCINCFVITLLIYGLIVCILIIFGTSNQLVKYKGNPYPLLCYAGANWLFLVVGACIILQDLAVTVGFLCAFIIPLRKTLKAIDSANADSKITRKILYAGTKTAVLTATATCSTIILTLFGIAFSIGFITATDATINIVCMIFMTAYYRDTQYYQKICCCCIACCDKRGRKEIDDKIDQSNTNTISNENEPTRTQITEITADTASKTNPASIDTMSQLRIAGNDTKISVNSDTDHDNM